MLGHVNNYRLFPLHGAGADRMDVFARGCARARRRTRWPVIVNASCNFKVPLVYPADVEVRMYLGDPGRTSIGSYYDLSVAGQRCADGAARMVWTDRETGKRVPLPKACRRTAARGGRLTGGQPCERCGARR